MRRQFILPSEDSDFLDSVGYFWETIIEKNHKWLLIHKFPIPKGYTVEEATLALRIDSGYPTSQIDMAYFYPFLERIDNKKINALAIQPLDLKSFQRWSRHRTKVNPWRPGFDNVQTHIFLIINWLEREFKNGT